MRIPDILYRFGLKLAYLGFLAFCFVFRPRTRGVVIAVRLEDDILIIKNSYYKKYTLPGGYVKRNETPQMAAARELKEEVGVTVEPAQLQQVLQVETEINFKREILTFFELKMASRPRIVCDQREVIWADFIPLTKALTWDLSADTRRCIEIQSSETAQGSLKTKTE